MTCPNPLGEAKVTFISLREHVHIKPALAHVGKTGQRLFCGIGAMPVSRGFLDGWKNAT
jgi:hypothetical protein